MRSSYYRKRISGILYYISLILIVGGILLCIPFVVGFLYREYSIIDKLLKGFILPGSISVLFGVSGVFIFAPHNLSLKDSMLICSLSWVVFAIIGGIPYVQILKVSYINAIFEAMSGFTTTGITVMDSLDRMSHSILFWRALTQWIGGLGILSMFVLLGFKGGTASNKLFLAESHKVGAKKLSPGIFHTAKSLWTIYVFFTLIEILVLLVLKVDFFDAITHSFTTLSTGGYSIYNDSIAHYRIAGYAHYHLIELTYMFFMLLGGINFLIHFRYLKGSIKSLWDNTEMRYLWIILFGGIVLIFIGCSRTNNMLYYKDANMAFGIKAVLFHLKDIGFQTISILTTTGYATRDINSVYFAAVAKQLFLVFMIIGGCAGSTGGGIKIIRVAILTKLIKTRLYKLNTSRLTVVPLTIDGEIIKEDEIKRVSTIFFTWILLLIIGGGVTALFSHLSGWESFSGMFSAMGNIGPCYISAKEMIGLHPFVKGTYIFGMLAGRLEIFPVLIIFSRRFFR
jgi:trk system potassium uptake protein TrkH